LTLILRDTPPRSLSAPALLRGTGSDRVHLLLVCTAERGLCGPFNTAIVRLVRERGMRRGLTEAGIATKAVAGLAAAGVFE